MLNWQQLKILFHAIFFATGISLINGESLAQTSSQDRADIDRIENYLNNIRTLSSNFIQVAPNGEISNGRFYLKRPGRLRFEYQPPSTVLIVSDGTYINYLDKKLGQLSQIGVYSTLLGQIIADKVELRDRVAVTSIQRRDSIISFTAIDAAEPERGALTLVFTEQPLELRKWIVKDTQGLITSITLENMITNSQLGAELFLLGVPYELERQGDG